VNPQGGFEFEDLSIGQSVTVGRTVTEADVAAFAAATGDTNPVHLDAEYAATTRFKERIAHGMLTAGHISAVLGTRLPGPGAIYVSQSIRFLRPVTIGSTVQTRLEVTALDEAKGFVTFACTCTAAGKKVAEGEAVVMVARRAAG
jgi:3-hydroxybutyryl-CoA dehydratase